MYRWLIAGLLTWMVGFVALPATATKRHKRHKPKAAASPLPKRPKPFTFVTDQAGLLSPKEEQLLDSSLRRYADTYGPQLVVVTVPNLGGRKVADYARALGTAWGVGQRHKNNGVVLLVAARERSVSIQAGSGLRKVITPAVTGVVINDVIGPCFRVQHYFNGLRGALNELIRATAPAEAGAAVHEFIPDPNRWVMAVDSTSQKAAAAAATEDNGFKYALVLMILLTVGLPALGIWLLVRFIGWLRNPNTWKPRPPAPAADPASYSAGAGGSSSYWSSSSQPSSSSHTHHHHHHHDHDHGSGSRRSSHSHRSSSPPRSSSSSGSSSGGSSYDDSSSDNTGGGGFDDRNDNSGTW